MTRSVLRRALGHLRRRRLLQQQSPHRDARNAREHPRPVIIQGGGASREPPRHRPIVCEAHGTTSAGRRPSTAGTVASNDSFGPSYRAWIAPDKAHSQFMVSIERENLVRREAEKVEESRRESVWDDFDRGAFGEPQEIPAEYYSARQFFLRKEDEPVDEECDKRASQLLNRSRATNVGFCYDHQGYIGI